MKRIPGAWGTIGVGGRMSIFAWYGYEGTLTQRAALLMESGFFSLSLWWEKEDHCDPEANVKALRRLGVSIDLVHLPYYPGGLWGEEHGLYEEAFLLSLEELHKSEIPLAVFHPSALAEVELPVCERGLEVMHRLSARAKTLGLELAAENLYRDPHLFALLDHVDIGLCLDTGHLGLSGNAPRLKAYFPRIKALHLHDNDGKQDLHLIPGDGVLPLGEWLRDVPGNVAYHLEINRGLSHRYGDCEERIYLKRARQSLLFLGGKNEAKF